MTIVDDNTRVTNIKITGFILDFKKGRELKTKKGTMFFKKRALPPIRAFCFQKRRLFNAGFFF